jgi:UDP-2-acetamido-3-amino-2,3-dideoxy-glucuronate N-acetyltransferase
MIYIHPTAIVSQKAKIGKDTKIWHWTHVRENCFIGENCVIGQNCYIAPNVTIGNNVKIQNNVSVYEGVIIEDNVFIGPSVVFTNVKMPRSQVDQSKDFQKTIIRNGASIGANSTIVCGNEIGENTFVGAGSLITKNIPANKLVYGSPAKIKRDL